MKIRRLRIEGFGRLRGEVTFDTDRCNLLLAPNESGKSTLVAALLAGLYGLPPERRSKNNPITFRDAHRPWGGGAYAVEVEFEVLGEAFRVRRDFEGDAVQVWEERTGKEVSARFRGEEGRVQVLENLLGLERDDFARSALVMQDEIDSIREGGDITLRLQKFATSQGGDITAGEAVECLDDALRRYEGTQLAGQGKVETELRRVQERLAVVRARQATLESEHAACAGDLGLLRDLGAREAELAADLHRLDLLRTRAIIAEIDEQVRTQEGAVAELTTLRAQATELASFDGFPLESRAEMNELKGKAGELVDRLQAEQSNLQREVEEPLAAARRDLEPHAAALALAPEEVERLEAAAVRLRDLRDARKPARAAARAERSRLRKAGVDLEEAAALRSRFATLDPEERALLAGFRARLLELDRDAAPRASAPAAASGGIRWALAAPGLLLLAGAAGAWLAHLDPIASGVLGALGIAGLGAGLLFRRAGGSAAPPRVEREDGLRQQVNRLLRRLEYPDLDAAVAAARTLDELDAQTAALRDAEEACDRADETRRATQEEGAALLARAGRAVTAEQVRPRDVEEVRDAIRQAQRLQERRADLEERAARGTAEVRSLQERLARHRGRTVEILRAAGIEPADPDAVDDADMQRFFAAADQAERLRQLRDDLIPAATSKVAAPEWLTRRRNEMRTMEEVLDEIRKRHSLDPEPEPSHSSNHYVLEFKRADDDLRQVQRRRREAFGRIGDVLRRYREEGPALVEEGQRLEAAERTATRFAAAVRLAAATLRDISRESYEEWATALNDRANRSLVHLNPGYRDLRFDTDLSFTLEDVATGRRLDRDAVDAQLSGGARDQVYLAIRLAVSDYFSAGRFKLPIILDDALSAADDSRFDRALAYIAERISPRHQVLLLSCHEARHARFAANHPDLHDGRILSLRLPTPEPESEPQVNAATATPSSD